MIPRRIIQTGKSRDTRVLFRAAAASLIHQNPDFEFLFFDDQEVEDFIDQEFSSYRRIVDSFEHRIQRYDFFRYLAVYHFGGFYFDQDVMLASSLEPLLRHDCVFSFERLTWSDYLRTEAKMDWEIGNYAFGATANHPFIELIIKNCVRAQEDAEWRNRATKSLPRLLRDELSVIYSTGPGLVSRTFAEYKNTRDDVTILFPEDVCDRQNWNLFGDYGIHLGVGSWRREQTSVRRRLINSLGKLNEDRAIREGRKLGKGRTAKIPS
jgi:mannosyltransferase OCH1-like enzyme